MSNPYYGQGQAQGYVYEPGNPQPRYDPDYANPAYAPSPDLSTVSNGRRFDQDPRTRRDHRRRSSSHYNNNNNNNNDEDISSTDSISSDDNEHRPHRHRRSSKNKSRAHKDPSSSSASLARSKSSNRLDKAREHFSTSDRGVGAGMIGAVAGAVLAQETAQRNGKGSIGATIAGLVLGGLAGNALEKGFDRKQEERKAATEKYDRRRDR